MLMLQEVVFITKLFNLYILKGLSFALIKVVLYLA